MSPQVDASPDEIERFALDLKQFNALLSDSTSRLQGQFASLGETWRDQEHQKFAQEFEQTMRVLHHFMRAADQQIPFLRRKAEQLRRFIQQR